MANLRILATNVADSATCTANSGNVTAPNMQLDIKSAVWRSAATVTTANITLQWAAAKFVNMVALAFTNLTSGATLRFRGYTLAADALPAADLTRSAFNTVFTGTNHACVYAPSPPAAYEKVLITITDTGNPAGLLEVSRIIAGTYWSPTYTAETGVTVTVVDTSKSERTDSGDLITERGPQYKSISFDLAVMPVADRDNFHDLLRSNGTYKPMFISITPEDSDKGSEQIFQIYGKQQRSPAMKYAYFNMFSSQVDIDEV